MKEKKKLYHTLEEKKMILEIAKEILIANIVAGTQLPAGQGLKTVAKIVEQVYDDIN